MASLFTAANPATDHSPAIDVPDVRDELARGIPEPRHGG
jgi:hypothetical protein